MKKPGLTLPKEEAAELERFYRDSKVILEYGSGGSTFLAASMPEKTIFSVESDAAWTANLSLSIRAHNVPSLPFLYYVDVGKTGSWGAPVDESSWKTYPDYSSKIWREPFFEQPDVVLVDGRFRVGCFIATLAHTRHNVTIMFDDYQNREYYHIVERYLKPERIVGRMAIFNAKPGMLTAKDVLDLVSYVYSKS